MNKFTAILTAVMLSSNLLFSTPVFAGFGDLIKANPGKTTAASLCAASLFFPPFTLLVCLGSAAGGFAYDKLTEDSTSDASATTDQG